MIDGILNEFKLIAELTKIADINDIINFEGEDSFILLPSAFDRYSYFEKNDFSI